MRPIRCVLDSNLLFAAMVLWLSLWGAGQLWPTSYWFEVRSVSAGPAVAQKAVPMVVDRSINQPFYGTWHVTVRRWSENGWFNYCTAWGTATYEAEATLPKELTLDWWTSGGCPVLDAGRYSISTSWRVDPDFPLVPIKTVSIESNIFEVTP